jgi:GNAT superfamily N-acetyltransferase
MRVTSSAAASKISATGRAERQSVGSRVRRALRAFAHLAFGDYGLYRIYSFALAHAAEPPSMSWMMAPVRDAEDFARSDDPSLRALATYSGAEAYAFGAWINGRLAAGCWLWAGDTYRRRNFWPLSPGDAKLIQVTTAEVFRGRGVAPALISFAAAQMKARGYTRLFARVWYSHAASRATFRKAGWTEEAFVAELFPFRFSRRIRWVWRRSQR